MAWGGGAPNISNTFASIFAWLDKLGLSALNGVKVVIRQSLANGWYGLLGENGDPTPVLSFAMLKQNVLTVTFTRTQEKVMHNKYFTLRKLII